MKPASLFLITFIFLMQSVALQAQRIPGFLGEAIDSINNLPDCSQIAVDSEGNLLLLDQQSGRLFKYLALWQYDSLISIGGKGNREEGFLSPTQLSTHNRQTLYVLDEAAQRIILLNPNLRVLESVDFLSLSGLNDNSVSLYPISFDVSGIGDLFILNQWDNKIYKRNERGQTERSFGGLDYGEGTLYEPDYLQVSGNNLVYVGQSSLQNIKVYDQFGLYRYELKPKTDFQWSHFRVEGDILFCWSPGHLYWEQLSNGQNGELALPGLQTIASDREFIYMYEENAVHLYRFKEK